ncbi:uncharacterized protein LOC127095593 [Lathyrus oleraceus]|uniref:uncharacterized protein LOC127095593 n=1 Tax=Pisum sativum TaxID=3888 RepID=UPI0021D01641|nr:uncharacterized protein LOC127095593 [Pisum sativum]
MATKVWMNLFPYYYNTHLPRSKSNHHPIILDFNSDLYQQVKRNPNDKPKRFEKLWMEIPNIKDMISQIWNGNSNEGSMNKLHYTLYALWDWGKTKFSNPTREINNLNITVKILQDSNHQNKNIKQISEIQYKIDKVIHHKEIWWAQRVIIHSLRDGDRNTKFFHQKANQMRSQNMIKSIIKPNGDIIYREDEIHDTIMKYYREKFKDENLTHSFECFNT